MHRHASLNRIFRLVWSRVQQAWVAVAETARGRGKRASRKLLLAASVLTIAPLAQAGPTGGQVTSGAGAIGQTGATTTVTQASQNLALQWRSFNTSTAESVNFVQPSRSAIAVNRIADPSPTQFFGKLNANGQVWLINPNGILFGATAQVNVGGLVASTLEIAGQSGDTHRFQGNGAGSIVNQGAITALDGGYVAFIGNRVGNAGTIAAPMGHVALGAGSDVTLAFAGNSLLGLQVNQSTLDNLAENGGLIRADGGAVVLSAGARDAVLASVVNNTGVIEAHSVRQVNGAIVLDGGAQSTVSNSGTLDASGRNAGETGGSVKALGQEVGLAAGSRIDVSGDAGGGTALVGGNFLGGGPERNAQNTTVAGGARLLADAVSSGAGGRVAVWSDGLTRFDGRISARGGAAGGDGGHVETSGKTLNVGTDAAVNTLAPHGAAGDWLLDPQDLTIGGFAVGDGDITGQKITEALTTTSVTIKTGPIVTCSGLTACSPGQAGNGDIIMANGSLIGFTSSIDGDFVWSGNTTLTLSAYRNVELRGTANLDASGGIGNMVLRADNTGTGVGKVILGGDTNIFGNGVGTLKIYYNPTSYAAPTNYAALMDTTNSYQLIQNVVLNTYMLVNLAATVAGKTYDGTTAATLTSLTPRIALPSGVTLDTSGAGVSFTDKNAGTNKATLVSGVVFGGANASQYAINGLDAGTATIAKANLAVTGVSANSKTYNGSTAATLSGSAAVTAFGADAVSVAGSGVGTFANKNVAVGKPVTVTGYTLAGTDAGNYNLIQPAGLTASINQANLAVTGLSALGKTYDGTTTATLAGTATVAAFGGDVVSVAGTGAAAFGNKNAGSNKSVTVTGYSLSGADAANYAIVQPAGLTATINQAMLAVSGLTALDKTYDATTIAALTGAATVSAFGSDVVSVSGTASAAFANKNAATGKTVTVAGLTLSGTDAGNYSLAQPAGLTASIARANLALTGISANNKTYDASTAVTFSGTATVAPIGSDAVSVAGSGNGAFADKNAGLAKPVTVGGFTLTGLDAPNYTLVLPAGLTADIARASLAVSGVTANNKTYDATTTATLGGTATVAPLGADAVTVAGSGAGVFATRNAGAGKAVAVTGYTLAGADAANYNVVQPAGVTATIGQASLAVTGVSALDKVYDGTSAASLAGTASVAPIGADVVAVSGTGTGSFADKNAGTGKAVAVTGYTLSGADAGNYTLALPAGLSASIARANLALAGLTANGKTYDGTTAATLAGTATVNAIGADAVSVAGAGTGAFVDKNAGLGKAVTVGGYTLAGLDAGNYTLVLPTGLSADIAKASLAVSGVTAADKTYDGTNAATLGGSATVAAFGSDVVSVAGPGAGAFASKNAGAAKTVTVTGYTLSGLDAGNYIVVQPAGVTASIHQARLAVGGVSARDKVYDGTVAASLAGLATVAPIGGDDVQVTGAASAAFADQNAGAGKVVVVSGYTLAGADAGNYLLAQPAGLSASIARANLVLAGVTANNKTYDGTTAATLSGTATVHAIGGDVVSVTGPGAGAFVDKNAGLGKTVTVGGYTLAGRDAGNYTLVPPTGLSADIARASLAVSGVTANDKTYDGTTAATLGGSATVAAFGSDAATVSGAGAGAFADKNAGVNKTVTASGYTLSGLDAANYTIVQPAGLTATVARAPVAISGLTAADKVYDGTVAASVTGTAAVTPIGSDDVGVRGAATAAFADQRAGIGKPVVVTGYTLGGADAGNYLLAQPAGLVASIRQASLALTGLTANSKIYDGTTSATLAGTATVNPIGAEVVSVAGPGAAVFQDKNAGRDKAVTVGGYALAGPDAGNYALVMPAGLTAAITQASLAVSGVVANDKTYDGTVAATLGGRATVAPFGSDVVTVAGSGAGVFADKNAGASKAVTAAGYSLIGSDAANYAIVQPTGLSAAIRQALIAVRGVRALDKVYDGTAGASLAGTAAVTPFGSDALAVTGSASATFADKNVGSAKVVAIAGYALEGADAANYTLVQPAGVLAAITPAPLVVTGIVASDKTFDGTTAATVSTAAALLLGKIGTDSVTVASNGAFADAAPGAGKTVKLTNTYAGADAGNYAIADQATAVASIAALPATPTVAAVDPVQRVVAQVLSTVLAPQASTQPQSLTVSSTLVDVGAGASAPQGDRPRERAAALVNTRLGAGPGAPTLQIQDGGVQLPPLAIISPN